LTQIKKRCLSGKDVDYAFFKSQLLVRYCPAIVTNRLVKRPQCFRAFAQNDDDCYSEPQCSASFVTFLIRSFNTLWSFSSRRCSHHFPSILTLSSMKHLIKYESSAVKGTILA